jgi:sec-independent protein translocase protein TatA
MESLVILGVVGPTELLVIVLIVVLLFGGRKIPELMKGIGEGMREFKKAKDAPTDTKSPEAGSKKE